jgi:hypothetical protein
MFLLIVTLVSMLLAAIMSAVAWRLAGEERRRSDARVEALAREIHGEDALDSEVARGFGRAYDELELRPTEPELRVDLFSSAAASSPAPSRSRAAVAAGLTVLVVGATAAFAIRHPAILNPSAVRNPQSATTAGAAAPLELVELGNERDGETLTVRGVVRNPASGARVDGLTAVVFLFARDGGFIASGRATVDAAPLAPGGESTFVVTVPGAADVSRFRVSFRTDDRVIPHVDKRHES